MAVWEIAIDQAVGGSPRPVANIFHLDVSEGAFPTAVASAVRSAWLTRILSGQSAGITCQRIRCRALDGISYAEETVGAVGGNTEPGISPNVSLMLRKSTPGLPRKRYGRLFVAGISEAAFDHGGNVALSYVNDWTTRGAGFLADLAGSIGPMVQPWWTTNLQGDRVLTSTHTVSSLIPAARAASQKRRLTK